MTESIQINLTFEISSDRLEDLFTCARQNSWVGAWFEKDANGNHLDHPLIGDNYAEACGKERWFELERDELPHQHDPERGLYALTPEKIQRGLTLLAKDFSEHFQWFLTEQEDADTGDTFLQLAIFGETLYG